MKPISQLLVYKYNNRSNAWVGDRNNFTVIDIDDKLKIKDAIQSEINKITIHNNGYVLVKYEGRMFLCEPNNIDRDEPFLRHEINYHPLQENFSI